LQLAADLLLINDLLILDIKKPNMINEATWRKSSSKDEKFNQLWKGITELKETMLIQNKKLDKLTTIEISLPATHFTSIYRITVLHILHFIPRVKDLYQLLYTVPFTLKAASFMGGLQPGWPLVLRRLQLPYAFYTSMYLEIIAVLHYNNHDGVFHACALKSVWKSLYFITVQ